MHIYLDLQCIFTMSLSLAVTLCVYNPWHPCVHIFSSGYSVRFNLIQILPLQGNQTCWHHQMSYIIFSRCQRHSLELSIPSLFEKIIGIYGLLKILEYVTKGLRGRRRLWCTWLFLLLLLRFLLLKQKFKWLLWSEYSYLLKFSWSLEC